MARLTEIERLGLTQKVIKLSMTKSAREIVEILKTEDNATISHTTIAKYIKEIRQERQEATRASIAETVTPGLNEDLKFYDEMLDTYRELFRSLSGRHPEKVLGLGGDKLADSVKVDPKGLAEIGKEYRATVESKVKIAGGNGSLDKMTNDELVKLITG